jgi:phosphohistidine phosphatase
MAHPRSIFLVRHAIAAPRGDKWPDDAKRPLTHEGAARMRRAVKGLDALDVRLDLVLASPLTRAQQTAEILVEGQRARPEFGTAVALAPGGAPARVAEALAEHHKAHHVALVGHEPGLGELAAWLIGAKFSLPMKKGGVCRIDVAEWPPAKNGQLIWLATPKMLRALAG